MSKALTIRNQIAVRDGLDVYLRGISKIPVLSRADERRLADKWFLERDSEAGKALVVSNLRFVVKIAKGYVRYGFKLPDLVQEGNLGLLHAVDKFDPRTGNRLISYAVWWIRAYIQAFILKSWSVVRMGTTRVQRRIFNGLRKARQMITAFNGGNEPESKQIAQVLDVSESELRETVSRMKVRDVSLDQPVTRNSDLSYVEAIPDESPSAESQIISAQIQDKVRGTLDKTYDQLTPRERYLLEHRLLADPPATLESVGNEFGVTRERVRQIEERLKTKLRKLLAPTVGLAPSLN